MRDKIGDGGETEIQRGQGTISSDVNANSLGDLGQTRADNGSLPIGATRTTRSISGSKRRKPVTHGKTLSFLIQSLADQLKESQEAQAREAARQVRIEQQLQQLQDALDAWRASVADVGEDSIDAL
jgi:hypothetical protein